MIKDDKNKCEEELETIKEKFELVSEKYDLPSFEELNADFEISKIECDTETILRDVRKAIISKVASWLNFVEVLLNPTTGSMFHMFLVKGINGEEKNILNELFKELGELELSSFELEINYDEDNEAKFIRKSFDKWQNIKSKLEKINNSLKANWSKVVGKKEKSYFG